MDDDNKVGLQTDPNDIRNIERLIQSVDKLSGSLEHLAGANRGMTELRQAMQVMQATMVTGFTELSIAAKKSDDTIVESRARSKDRMLADEVKAWDKLFHTSQAALSRMEAQQDASDARRLEKAASARMRELELEVSAENKRAASLQALTEKRDAWLAADRAKQAAADAAAQDRRLAQEISAENRRAASLQASMEKQDLWMAEERGRQAAAQAAALAGQRAAVEKQDLWLAEERGRQYAAAAAHQSRLESLALASAEKQRVLNTNFVTSPLSSQISVAERAAVYSSLGGDAGSRYGTTAAAADLAALRRQYELMTPAQRAAAEGASIFNNAMSEGHALARGLSGSLGALWLTYGSLVPLAAGAAIGASLKNIVTVGKEVEYQLKFVEALGNAPVKVEDFLRVTDGTVVSIKEAAEGMRALSQNGLDAVQSLQILPTILNLSVIGEMSVGAAALSATGAISAFGLTLNDAARVGDVFAQAAASSNTSVALMAESMKQASTVASLYHVTLEETAAGLGQLAKINITGSAAGTALTNMLTGLYSPTAKAEKALAQLNITTDDGKGGLKEMTTLLGELRGALSQYNESARAVLLNDIFTTRGTKAASQLLSNFEEYKGRIDDAANSAGFMSAAVAKLEDSTEGAFKRMKNNITSSLVETFKSASPGIQALVTDLGTLAGSRGAVETLTGLADATLRLTNTLIENGKTIGTVALAYVTLRTVATLATVATAQATATTTAGFLATSAAATTLAGSLRLIVSSLGWISLAFTAAVTVYELFINKTSDVEKADQRLRNSIDSNIEYIKRETLALQERNKAWNPKTQQFDLKPEEQNVTEAAQQRVLNAQKTLDSQAPMRSTNVADWMVERAKNLRELKAAQDELHAQEMSQAFLSEGLDEERARKEKANVLVQIADLVRKGETETTINGKIVQLDEQGNAKSRAIALEARKVQQDLLDGTLSTKQAQIELLAKRQEYNAALKGAPEVVDKKSANDSLAAAIAEVAQAKELLKIRQQTAEIGLKEDNKQGRLGDLGLLQAQVALQQQAAAASIAQAKADIDLVSGVENKRAATQKYYNQLAVAREQEKQNAEQAKINVEALRSNLEQQNVRDEAEALTKRGQLLDAFLLDYEAKYGKAISRALADQKLVQGALASAKDDPFADPKVTEELSAYNDQLERYLLNRRSAKKEGSSTASFNEAKQSLDTLLSDLDTRLNKAKATGSEEGGLSGALGVGDAALAIQQDLLPQITALQNRINELAQGTPALEKLASDANKKVSADVLQLAKAAQPFGNAWTDIWKTVESSAHGAWMSIGTGGENTMKKIGNAIRSSILDMLYQLTIKKWIIQIGASFSNGAMGDLASLVGGGAAGSAGAAGGGAGMLGTGLSLFNTGKSLYNLISGGTAMTIGGGLTSLGNLVGSQSLSGFGMGFSGWGPMAEAYAPASSISAGATTASYAIPALAALAGNLGGKALSGGYSAFGGSGNSAVNTGTAVGAVVGSVVPVIGTAIGALVGGPLGGLTNRLFGYKSTEVTGTGVRGTLTEQAVTGESYTEWLKKGGWFRSDKRGTDVTALSSEFQNSLLSGLVQVKALTEGFGKSLGLDTGSLAGYSKQFDIKLDQKDASKNTQAITDFFTQISDELATRLIPNISQFAKVGETAGTTLERLASNFQSTNVIAELLGKTAVEAFGAAGLSSITAREQFINLSGGIDALSSKITSYSQNYLSPEEQNAPVVSALSEAFAKLGVAAPKTRDEFKNLVSGLDLTNAAQVKTFNSLMDLQAAFAQVTPAIDKVAERSQILSTLADLYELTGDKVAAAAVLEEQHQLALKGMSAELAAATKQLWAAQEAEKQATKAAKESADRLSLLARLYAATGDEAGAADVAQQQLLASLVDLTPAMADLTKQVVAAEKVASARKTLDEAYKREADSLKDVIEKTQTFSDAMNKYKSSLVLSDLSPLTPQEKYLEARAQFDTTLAAAKGGDTTAQGNLTSIADAFLQASKEANASSNQYVQDYELVRRATENTSSWAEQQVNVAKASLAALDKQVAGLLTVDSSVKSVAQAIADLAKLQPGAGDAQKKDAIESLYQTLLGRHSEQAGMDFWLDKINNGWSIGQIAQGFTQSPEYQKMYQPQTAFTTDSPTRTVMRGNIPSAQETDPVVSRLDALIRQGADQAEEIRQLKATQAALMAAQSQAEYNTAMSAAQIGADATRAAADKIVGANQSKVAPK